MTARLARSRPGSDGYRGRLMPSLTLTTAGSGSLNASLRRPVSRPRPGPSGGHLKPLDPGHARPGRARAPPGCRPDSRRYRRPRCPHRSAGARPACAPPAAIAAAVATGPHSRPSVSSSTPRCAPSASMSRSCAAASGGPSVSTETRAAEPLGQLDGLLHRALLVRADGEARGAGVDFLPVGGHQHLPADGGHPLDADQDVHPGQHRIRSLAGSNSGVAPATATVTGYSSPMYSTVERRARHGLRRAAGRPAAGACRTDGPDPALVT